ncbi:unnamed protein product, partial [Nesidiocoris tenuis]
MTIVHLAYRKFYAESKKVPKCQKKLFWTGEMGVFIVQSVVVQKSHERNGHFRSSNPTFFTSLGPT